MAGYVKLLRSIWRDPEFRALPAMAQRLYLLLISQPDISHAGVLTMAPTRWASLAPGMTADDVRHDLTTLALSTDRPFVVIDGATEELWVRSYIKYDEAWRSPNGKKALLRACESILSDTIRGYAVAAVGGAGEAPPVGDASPHFHDHSHEPGTIDHDHTSSSSGASPALAYEAWAILVTVKAAGYRMDMRKQAPNDPPAWLSTVAHVMREEQDASLRSDWASDVPIEDAARRAARVPMPSEYRVTAPALPRMHYDPNCPDCHGEGLRCVSTANHGTYAECTCGRSEPYTDATVLTFPTAVYLP